MNNPRRVLMCKPQYFDIEYCINPWMDRNAKVDRARALEQWEVVRTWLSRHDVKIELVEPVPGLPDMTFTGDAGFVIGQTFIPSNFRYQERAGENGPFIEWFSSHGWQIRRLPPHIHFEGLGDIVRYQNEVMFGYGFRSSLDAVKGLKNLAPQLEVSLILELRNPKFYHAGLCFAQLDAHTVLFYEPAFDADGARAIRERFRNAIDLSEQDAVLNLAANNITCGRDVLMGGCSAELESRLLTLGYQVTTANMSEFVKSGGGLRCLALDI